MLRAMRGLRFCIALGGLLPIAVGCLFACQPPPPATPAATATSSAEAPAPPLFTEPEAPAEAEPAPAPAASEAKPIEPGIAPTGAPTRGKLPKGVIEEKLTGARPAIQACYQRALAAQPKLRGNLSINFVVAPDGKVAHAEAVEVDDELTDAPTVECILAEVRKLDFPEPSGGRVFINYPLKLEPAAP
jgi:hypothetical protein